jgi:hypothetical protein
MNRLRLHLAAIVGLAITFGPEGLPGAESKRSPAAAPLSYGGDAVAGEALRQKLLEQQPVETTVNGLLKLRDGEGNRSELPVRIETKLLPDGRSQTTYETSTAPRERLVVQRDGLRGNRFFLGVDGAELKPLPETDHFRKFAGTDFTAADLGLQFLHWPRQVELARQLRRGRSCTVLESSTTNAVPGGYVRVRSWVDTETGGILHADAFDAEGKHAKEFSLRSFKKVDGRWQLREMEIIDLRVDSRTRLEFDLTLDAPAAER